MYTFFLKIFHGGRKGEREGGGGCLGLLRISVLLYNISDLQVFHGLRHGKDKALIWF